MPLEAHTSDVAGDATRAFARARQCAAAGRHQEALALFVIAIQKGDAAAGPHGPLPEFLPDAAAELCDSLRLHAGVHTGPWGVMWPAAGPSAAIEEYRKAVGLLQALSQRAQAVALLPLLCAWADVCDLAASKPQALSCLRRAEALSPLGAPLPPCAASLLEALRAQGVPLPRAAPEAGDEAPPTAARGGD